MPWTFSLQTLCTIHLLIQKLDENDKLPDFLPDLTYTLLLQLGSSHRPEAAPPVLKMWKLVHTAPLPEEMNLQRCSRGWWVQGSRPGLGVATGCPLVASGLH